MKSLSPQHKQQIKALLNGIVVFASALLIINISLEAFNNDSFMQDSIYFDVQFWICIYFTLDFFILLLLSDKKWQFFKRYFILLFLSIPYLSLIKHLNIQLTAEQLYLIHLIPLTRGAVAMVLVVYIIVQRNTTALFISYLILLTSIIYFLTLIFFIAERGINPEVKTYYDSLWWAAMTVTTLGSTIQPVTVAGKIITTSLATVGLTIFPIFTAFVTTIVNKLSQNEIHERQLKAQQTQATHKNKT